MDVLQASGADLMVRNEASVLEAFAKDVRWLQDDSFACLR